MIPIPPPPPNPPMAQQLLVGQGLLVIETTRSYSDTLHALRLLFLLLWMSDRSEGDVST